VDPSTASFRALALQVRAMGLLDRRPGYYRVKITLTILAFLAGWAAFVAVGNSWMTLAVAPLAGVTFTQLGFIGHDAGHNQIFSTRRRNRMRISHTVDGATVAPRFASSPRIRRCPPQRILPDQANGKAGDAQASRRASRLAPVARVVLPRRQPAVPVRQRRGRHRGDLGPAPARRKPRGRGEQTWSAGPVLHPAGGPPQYRVLMPEHQQLGILRQVTAEHQDSQAEHAAREQVDDLEQHLAC